MRLRLTLIYGALFLASGAGLLAITYLLVASHPFPPRPSHQTAPPVYLAPVLRAAELNQLLGESGIALAIMTVVSAALGWLVASRMLRPLQTMARTTQRISEKNLHERFGLHGSPSELKDLGDTLDDLLARLEAAFDAQRRFIANASHELRTPLALSRTLLEDPLTDPAATIDSFRSACQEALAAGEQQEQLIEALLTLARSQRGLDGRSPVDLGAIASNELRARQADATARSVHLSAAIRPTCLLGEARLIERMVSNLIDNALRYNMPGGHVKLTTGVQAGQAILTVTNTGPQVPAAAIERLFQPFQRLADDRTGERDGLGLGLSIVAAIAQAHGADLAVQPAPGGGLDITVTFPAPEPSSSPHQTAMAATMADAVHLRRPEPATPPAASFQGNPALGPAGEVRGDYAGRSG